MAPEANARVSVLTSQIQPFATFINGVATDVATSTPLDREWANAT